MVSDDEIRMLLTGAAGTPTLNRRNTLLDALVERIESGGVEVAEAPDPRPFPELVHTTPRRTISRVAGIGLVGWGVLALGTAAAAAGAWLAITGGASPSAVPQPSATHGSIAPSPQGSPSPTPSAVRESPIVDAAATVGPVAPPDVAPRPDAQTDTVVNAGADPQPVKDAVDDTVDGVVDTVEHAAKDVLAPVIGAIGVDRPVHGLIGLLSCDATIPISVSATDNTAVTSAAATVTTASGFVVTVPLHGSSAGEWTGDLTSLSLAKLLSLGSTVSVVVEASDAAGNKATASTSVSAKLLACA